MDGWSPLKLLGSVLKYNYIDVYCYWFNHIGQQKSKDVFWDELGIISLFDIMNYLGDNKQGKQQHEPVING